MEWSSVQVLRPSVSTSAGQSVAGAGVGAGAGALMDLAWDAQAEKASLEEQERHLLLGPRVSGCFPASGLN